ncbi:hypothetical protein GGR57DRAFT_445118 [Xylariaceae sp. FL1272]|nr:hypothetical protein GGR57DRAFT_445118 [Xylariaceae sp. FL1272]
MVDAMTRSLDSWGYDLYASRQSPYYAQDQSTQCIRLPPASSLLHDVHYHQVAPSEQDHAPYNRASFRHIQGPEASVPHPSVQAPRLDSRLSSHDSRPVERVDQLSPSHSPTASDQSEAPSDHSRLRQLTDDRKPSSVPRISPWVASAHEPSQHLAYAEAKFIRPTQDSQARNSHHGHFPQAMTPPQQTWPTQPDSQRMKIADLLSHEQGIEEPKTASTPQRAVTCPDAASTYRIRVRQQPAAARSCGFGERDRRVIDPPPIVQVTIEDPTTSENDKKARLSHKFSIMHCTIWNEAGDQDVSSMPEDFRTQRRLMGTVVSSPFIGLDENDEQGCFFCFPDLSCRTPGCFRLNFSFVVLSPRSVPGNSTPVAAVVMSEVFTVYNAKDFPGMRASTALTRRLKEQGCLISIKKGNEKSRTREESVDEYDEGGEEGEGVGPNSAQRRAKRPRNA